MGELEPLPPDDAVEMYLQHREPDLSEKTLQNQRYRLNSFLVFCEEHDIDDLTQLTGRDLHRFRVWRRNGDGNHYGPVNAVSLKGILDTLRKFLEFAASVNAVEKGMREKVLMPEIDPEDEQREEMLEASRAERIIDFLDQFRYASREHVILALLWHTGMRLGALRSLDVGDFDRKEPALQLRHRPESGTPLKNARRADRDIAVGAHYARVLEDYIDHHRHDVTDDHGRRPLITSEYGRLTESPIRNTVYRWTQPCRIGECPHDRDPKTCEWTNVSQLKQCPSARSPHGVRRGSITKHRKEGVPREVVSERVDASDEVLEKHYDQRSKRERMRNRRNLLENI
ncbi:MAG: tyrosine-type recombinase/integrase [Halodesulfurarchaeum sp.]